MCTNGSGSVPRIMVFRPSLEEMKDFPAYIAYVESQGANKAGLTKIIPPKEWCPRADGYKDINLLIPAPISQVVHGRQGLYQQINIQKKSITVKDFQKLAESEKYATPNHFDYEDLERKYWRNISYNSPIYGADVSGSLYDKGIKEFNINHLDSILDLVNEDYGIRIEGVNTAYLYFGMWKTTFPWHTEDMDLYSINYLHFGAPKSWYAIPPEHGRRLERLAAGFFPGHFKSCPAFLRHKMTIISPAILKQYSIPFNKITQEPGEFMVTFPFGYHAGFNHGFNCAESTNFAMPRWVEYGKRALQCSCRKDGVKISMDAFVRNFQPDRYELWKIGKDIGTHPEDPSRLCPAAGPTKMELTACARATTIEPANQVQEVCEKEERRRYKTETGTSVSKRHPISHMEIKDELCTEEECQTDDTEIYDIGEIITTLYKKKRKVKDDKVDSNKAGDTVTVKTKKKIKKEPNPDKLVKIKKRVKKEKNKADLHESTPFIVTEDASKSQGPVKKLIISKKLIPSTTGDAVTVTKFEIKEAPFAVNPVHGLKTESPPNIIELSTTSGDNSNLMALAQLAEDVGLRRELSQCLTSNENSTPGFVAPVANLGFQAPHQVTFVKNPSERSLNLLTKISSMKSPVHVRTSNQVADGNLQNSSAVHIPTTTHHPFYSSVSLNVVIPSANSKNAINVHQSVPGQRVQTASCNSWSRQKHIPVYVPLPATVTSPNGSLQSLLKVGSNSNSPVSLLSRPVKIETSVPPGPQWVPEPEHIVSVSPPHASHVHQPKDIKNSLQKETCLHENGHVPQVAHMHQHQKLHKMLHDYARLERESPSPEVLNLSKKSPPPEIKLEGWAKSLSDLWQFRPPNFEAEKAFNISSSVVEPHCAICTVFKALRKDFNCETIQLPSSSVVVMPSSAFQSSSVNQYVLDSNPLLSPEGIAPLLQCTECNVCVHATCYGVTIEQLSPAWKCARCSSEAKHVECCLCPLRGGALKMTSDGRWAHVLCAVLIPGAMFGSIVTKEPIDLSKIKQARLRLSCLYCNKFTAKGVGVCIQCYSGKCSMSFHVTCAHAAGVVFETSNWPSPTVFVTCTRHNTAREKREENRQFTDVKIGDKAIAKYRNKRYYSCEVQNIDKRIFYSVDFEDGSFSDNLFPEDIVSHNCLEQGPPKVNEHVQVKWTDNKRYSAFFKGTRTRDLYTVEFENGEQLQLRREDFYTSNEELPKKVLSRVSTATDRQHADVFEEREVDGKRIRFVNTKYHSSEVVPL